MITKLYHWIDRRGRIPRWVFWIWRKAHWCPEMDGLLVMDNPEDCFCGHAKQPMALCPSCGVSVERRTIAAGGGVCFDCMADDVLANLDLDAFKDPL